MLHLQCSPSFHQSKTPLGNVAYQKNLTMKWLSSHMRTSGLLRRSFVHGLLPSLQEGSSSSSLRCLSKLLKNSKVVGIAFIAAARSKWAQSFADQLS